MILEGIVTTLSPDGTVNVAPKRGLMEFSVCPPLKWVGRIPALSVSHENGLNLSSI